MIPEENNTTLTVPWMSKDVWWGSGVLFALMLGMLVSAFFLPEMNVGLALIVGEVLLLLPVWWFGIRKYKAPLHTLGLGKFPLETVAIGCGLMILSWGFNLVYSLTLGIFGIQMQPDFGPLFADTSSPWGILIGGALIAPLVEEIIFRGFIFAGLREEHGWVKAALFSSALFALIHLQPAAIVPIFILGMIFAYLYQRCNSIWPAVIMHVSTNTIALVAVYLATEYSLI